jgi:hypothetical protein
MTLFSMIIKEPGKTAQPGRACKLASRELPSSLVRLVAHLRAETYKTELSVFPLKEKIHAFLKVLFSINTFL